MFGPPYLAEGLHSTEEGVRAITHAPSLMKVPQFNSFFGFINYYANFLPQLSSTIAPLYGFFHQKTKWRLDIEPGGAFSKAKEMNISPRVLARSSEGVASRL